MYNKFSLLFLIFISQLASAQKANTPIREIENVEDGIIVTYKFPNSSSCAIMDHLSKTYHWTIPGFALNDEEGQPEIPFRIESYNIYNNTNVKLEIIDSVFSDTLLTIAPAYTLPSSNNNINSINGIKPYSGFFPCNTVSLCPIQRYKNNAIQQVVIQPVWYDYKNKTVRYFSLIKYKLIFGRPDIKNSTLHYYSNPFINNITSNSNSFSTRSNNDSLAIENTKNYLIITINDYLSAVNSFAEWKRTLGKNTIIESKQKGQWTVQNIKQTIANQLSDHEHIDYILIVGDYDDVPGEPYSYTNGDETYNGLTDLYYGITDGDNIPDIYRGRIPVNTNNEANIVFNKIINYERQPVLNDSMYIKGVHCAFFEDEKSFDAFGNTILQPDSAEDKSMILTSELIRNHLIGKGKIISREYVTNSPYPKYWANREYSYGGLIPNELLFGNFAWNGSSSSIINSINEGVFYVLQKDHGGQTLWGYPGFNNNSIQQLNNGNKLPIVFSISCLTGKYNYSNGDCFAESFLKKANGGCVAIFAATESAFSGYDDALALGMFDAIWPGLDTNNMLILYGSYQTPTPTYELGQILDQGLYRMKESFGSPWYNANKRWYTYKIFHCFGDPSMKIFTSNPCQIPIPHITVVNNTINIVTTDGDADISFYNPSTINPTVTSFYGNNVNYHTDADSLIISINRHNYIPLILHYNKNTYIQNETITEQRHYIGGSIYIGTNVTESKPTGPVILNGANIKINGGDVIIQPETTITNSNIEINIP